MKDGTFADKIGRANHRAADGSTVMQKWEYKVINDYSNEKN